MGNVQSIRKQLIKLRKKKAETLKAIKQLKEVDSKLNVSKQKKVKFKLDFSLENIRSLPLSEEAYVQMTKRDLKNSKLPEVDPKTRFTASGNPITSEWNLLPNDLYLKTDI